MYIMLKNTPVIKFSSDFTEVTMLNNRLAPFSLRNSIVEIKGSNNSDLLKAMTNNALVLENWMSNRVLSLSRDNAKQIYTMFGVSQSNDIRTRVKICIMCKGISIMDSYWIKDDNETKTWEQVNIRRNHFSEIVDIALNGENPTITTNAICPELTTKGLFRKAWIIDKETNELYLLKSDKHINNINTHMEVLASHILDCFTNIEHVQYTGRIRNTKQGKIYVDKCKNFVTEQYSFIEAREVMEYCRVCNIDYASWALNTFGSKFANIAVIDYIIMNTDRHDENYGFLMDNNNGLLVNMAPLFDYNLALVSDAFGINAENTLSQMLNTKETILGLAKRAVPYCRVEINFLMLKEVKKYFKTYGAVYDAVLSRISKVEEKKL
jgi:hypothetical protein